MSWDEVPDQSIQKAEKQIPLSDRLLKLEYYDFIMARVKCMRTLITRCKATIPGWINLFCFIKNVK